jgi:protein-disulfide isomerase
MKTGFGIGAIALALLLAGCGGNESNLSAIAANSTAPLPQIPAPNNGDWTEVVSETPEGGYRMGNPDAPVKLVEYASITCPFCARFTAESYQPLTSQYVHSGQVSWEYRPFMIHPTDPGVFALLRCRGPQTFFRLAEQRYATQDEWAGRLQSLPQSQLERLQSLPPTAQQAALVEAMQIDQFFRQRGMPQAQIDSCLADPATLRKLSDITNYGTNHDGVTGTPTLFVNGEKQDNVGTWQDLEPRLRAAMGQ